METNAVGRRCTNAVAIRTPVPKCLERKRKRCGIGRLGKRRAMIGKEHARYCLVEVGAPAGSGETDLKC